MMGACYLWCRRIRDPLLSLGTAAPSTTRLSRPTAGASSSLEKAELLAISR